MSTVLKEKQIAYEAVGPAFTKEQMLKMRGKTRAIINQIAAFVKPGMLEEDAVEQAKELLATNDMVRGWHDVYVRFGTNTLKTFGAPSDPGIILKDNDIFLIDIGPVWEDWEGDGGDTFVVGSAPEKEKCAADARTLFHTVRHKWENTGLTGKELYEFAVTEAQSLGWELNMDLSGHRLSNFPHAAIYDGPMADVDFKPSPLLWVLEIHIRHPTDGYGAFYEDMLLDDSYFS
ncbi:MAG: M24 family metallopeptidase [Acidiphilium sp.]|nr:M24 family metallopeptidase [Acidiphilium sp.]MDD4936122.1 M24 family metallopeptidase [Acidiphilium sp.]